MDYLRKKVFRSDKRSEDVHISRTISADGKICRIKIGCETPMDEQVVMAYLKLFIDEWGKEQTLNLLDADDVGRKNH